MNRARPSKTRKRPYTKVSTAVPFRVFWADGREEIIQNPTMFPDTDSDKIAGTFVERKSKHCGHPQHRNYHIFNRHSNLSNYISSQIWMQKNGRHEDEGPYFGRTGAAITILIALEVQSGCKQYLQSKCCYSSVIRSRALPFEDVNFPRDSL